MVDQRDQLLDLTRIDVTKLTTEWTDGRETEGHALELQYGGGHSAGLSARWLVVTEGTSREEMPLFGSFGAAPPAPGELLLAGLGDRDGRPVIWRGSMELDGVFITLGSPQREVVVAAAHAMTPIR